MITIYGSNASRATRNLWVLEELGVPYKQDKISADDRAKPAYREINPAGKIPSMSDDNGNVAMFESLGINLYIAQRYGAGKLWPSDPAGQAKCIQWTMWAATEVEGHVVSIVVEKVFKPEPARNLAVAQASEEKLLPALKLLDGELAKTAWLGGNAFNIGDLQVACVLSAMNMVKFDWSAYPNVGKWLSACLARDAHKKVAAMPRT